MKILISGIPGGGKTSVGESLRDLGFQHIDAEANDFLYAKGIYEDPDRAIDYLRQTAHDTVITWGFGPLKGQEIVRRIHEEAGFKLVWFDGWRPYFFTRFMMREGGDTAKELEFYGQMTDIIDTGIRDSLPWHVFNPFDDYGAFRSYPAETLLRELADQTYLKGVVPR